MFDSIDLFKYDNLIFTEGGPQIGLGHLTRCVALYDELETRNLKPLLVVYCETSIKSTLGDRRHRIDSWFSNYPAYFNGDSNQKPNAIIDSYIADKNTYEGIQKLCNKVLYIDDTNRMDYPAGIVVNPSIYGGDLKYKKQEGQRYLTGIDHVIVRKDFQIEYQRKIAAVVNHVLLIFGGSDITNLTPQVMKYMQGDQYYNITKHVVIGKGSANKKEIEKIVENRKDMKVYYNLDASQLSRLMRECDLAFTAAGQTIYELIALQLPFACIQIVDNQEYNIKGLLNYRIIDNYFNYAANRSVKELNEFLDDFFDRMRSKEEREKKIEIMSNYHVDQGVLRIIDVLTGRS